MSRGVRGIRDVELMDQLAGRADSWPSSGSSAMYSSPASIRSRMDGASVIVGIFL